MATCKNCIFFNQYRSTSPEGHCTAKTRYEYVGDSLQSGRPTRYRNWSACSDEFTAKSAEVAA